MQAKKGRMEREGKCASEKDRRKAVKKVEKRTTRKHQKKKGRGRRDANPSNNLLRTLVPVHSAPTPLFCNRP